MDDRDGNHPRQGLSLVPALSLAVGHGTVDLYGSFIIPLLPLFAERFDLSLTLVGSLVSIAFVADGLSQPFFGYVGDQMRRPWMAMLAPLWVAVATGFLGFATGYGMLVILVISSGTGRSAFHPQGAASVTQYAGRRQAFTLSLFTAVGELGFSLGPILATALIALAGFRGILYAMPLGLVVTALLYTFVFKDGNFRPASWKPPDLKEVLGTLAGNRRNLIRLWLIVVIRSIADLSLIGFLPVLLTLQGWSTLRIGVMISVFLFGGVLGGLVGGWVSDRLGEGPVIVGSLTMAFVILELALILPGIWGTLFLILGSFCLVSSNPVTIGLAQRCAPESAATASSLMLGFGWGTGGLMVTFVGVVADQIGLIAALRIVTLCLIIAILLALSLPSSLQPQAPVKN